MVLTLRATGISLCCLVLLSACSSQPGPRIIPAQQDEESAEFESDQGSYAPAPSRDRQPAMQNQDKSHSHAAHSILDRASAALTVQQWKQASRYLEQAQRMAPQLPRVYLLFGDYYSALQEWARARAMYQRCLSLAPASSNWARSAQLRLQKLP